MKHALITGASRGIGLDTARRFRAAGYRVTAVALDFPDDFPLADDGGVETVAADLSDLAAIPGLVAALPPVDTLVNNAGVMLSKPWDGYGDDARTLTLAVNLEAPVALIEAVAPAMFARGAGRIVNNTSIAAHIGHPDIWYGATKAGLLNATKSFAKLLGPRGVLVNAVAAGPVQTHMLDSIPPSRREQIAKTVISGRFALPSEVAEVMFWLGAECPDYLNGVVIDINNGAYMR